MANTFKQPGMVLTLTAPAGGVVINEGYFIDSFFVIVGAIPNGQATADAGEEFEGQVGPGVFKMAKVQVEVWTEGVDIFWDDTAKLATIAGPADGLIGAATASAVNPSDVGFIRLNGVSAAEPASASIFVSAQQTATGAAQLIAHGLGVIPSAVTVHLESGHNGAAAVGDLTPLVDSDGAHDATNVEVTITSGALFKVTAYV